MSGQGFWSDGPDSQADPLDPTPTEDGALPFAEAAQVHTPVTGPDKAGVEANETSETAPKRSQADKIVDLVEKRGVVLFTTAEKVGFAEIPVGDHREVWPIRSRGFRQWLAAEFYAEHNKVPASQATQDALNALEGKAIHAGKVHPVHVRIATEADIIYLDLGDPNWRVVEITATGWRVRNDAPIRFRRPRGLGALPEPTPGGDIARLREFVNVTDKGWPLYLGALVAAVRGKGPFPVMVLYGAQGSAKTWGSRIFREMVDPNAATVRAEPRDLRDLMLAATNGWVVCFDNVSGLRPQMSDALCRLSTGGGFSTRELYSDSEEVILDAQRPVVLNGIAEPGTRADLLDRAVLIEMPAIPDSKRKSERVLLPAFHKVRPAILGALLDAVVVGLRNLPTVDMPNPPRMADFAEFVVASEPALGLRPGEFMAAYTANRRASHDIALEDSTVAQAVVTFVTDLAEGTPWIGTATELVAAIRPSEVEHVRDWPKTGQGMGGVLRRFLPSFAAVGVKVTPPPPDARPRNWRLENEGEPSSETSEVAKPQVTKADDVPTKSRRSDDENVGAIENVGEETPSDLRFDVPDVPDVLYPSHSGGEPSFLNIQREVGEEPGADAAAIAKAAEILGLEREEGPAA